MTAPTVVPAGHRGFVEARLDSLREQREQARQDIAPQFGGDDADRATNVEAHVRLAMLTERIAVLEADLATAPSRRNEDGVVSVGDMVSVDFGDGPEHYLLDSVERAGAGVDVITPGSPLGQALLGAQTGTPITYRVSGTVLQVRVTGIAG